MSNRLAIAAVTACLRNLLASALAGDPELADTMVTAQPLDKARDAAATANQLNLFLYMISPNAAWRNQDMPGRTRPGEVASPPLALNLFYLVSAYGRDNDVQQPFSQVLLGQAMSALYDHPLLGHDEIAAALPGNDLGDQPERVRVTLQPLSIEDISKLWAGFQMQYRLSVAYEVAVVLIDPLTPVRAGPPVLARGPTGAGFLAGADPLNAFPQLFALSPSRPLRAGETLTLQGAGLLGGPATAQFTPRVGDPVRAPATVVGGTATVIVPAQAAGPCTIDLSVAAPDMVRVSNSLALMIAPSVTSAMPAKISLAAAQALTLTIAPRVMPAQRAALIVGNQEVSAEARVGTTATLAFDLSGFAPGTYLARVRIDGVDSLPFLDPRRRRAGVRS